MTIELTADVFDYETEYEKVKRQVDYAQHSKVSGHRNWQKLAGQ